MIIIVNVKNTLIRDPRQEVLLKQWNEKISQNLKHYKKNVKLEKINLLLEVEKMINKIKEFVGNENFDFKRQS